METHWKKAQSWVGGYTAPATLTLCFLNVLFVPSARASTEPDTVELRTSQFLSKGQIHGPHRTIRDRVTNEGCTNA